MKKIKKWGILLVGLFSGVSFSQEQKVVFIRQDVSLSRSLQRWGLLVSEIGKIGNFSTALETRMNALELEELIEKNEGHVLIDTPFNFSVFDPRKKLEPSFIMRRFGDIKYAGCLVTKDKRVKSISDFLGKVVAMRDPYSTSGFALPMMLILEKLPQAKFKFLNTNPQHVDYSSLASSVKIPSDTIGILFVGEEETGGRLVEKDVVMAASWACQSAEELIPKGLSVYIESENVYSNIVGVHQDLPQKQKEMLYQVLRGLKDSPGLKAANASSFIEVDEKMKKEILISIDKMKKINEIWNQK